MITVKSRHSPIFLVTFLVMALIAFGTLRGHDYLTVRGLKIDAQRLGDKGEYQEAIDRLAETEGKWTTQNIRNQVKQDVEEYKLLAESTNNFDHARLKYDAKDYEVAIELFKKVLAGDVNYKAAQKYIVLTQEKLAQSNTKEQTGSVAGIDTYSTPFSEIPVNDFDQSTSSPLSLPIPNFQFYNPFSNQSPAPNQPTSSPQPTTNYETSNKPSREYCNSQLTYLDSQYQSSVNAENRSYQRRKSEIDESFASRGLYGSGIHKSELGLLAVEHNENLDSLRREYDRNVANLVNAGCNF